MRTVNHPTKGRNSRGLSIKNELLQRFHAVKESIQQSKSRQSNRLNDTESQVRCAHLVKHVEDYGFNFFPEHYVKEQIEELETLIQSC